MWFLVFTYSKRTSWPELNKQWSGQAMHVPNVVNVIGANLLVMRSPFTVVACHTSGQCMYCLMDYCVHY